MTLSNALVLLYAALCGGVCFVIAFMYQRNGASYRFFPSLCAFVMASLFGQEWLRVVGSILLYGKWPEASFTSTLILGLLFALVIRSKGNVAKLFLKPVRVVRATN